MATIEVKKVYKLIRNHSTYKFFTEDHLEEFKQYCKNMNNPGGFYYYEIAEIPFMDFLIEVANHCTEVVRHDDFTWWDKEDIYSFIKLK
jgi:hypothetical protein